jgi:hypothetical protein
MGEVTRMTPKGGLPAREYIQRFLDDFGDHLHGVITIAIAKDGDMINGWSKEVESDVVSYLGALEALKSDFWYTLFEKRSEH